MPTAPPIWRLRERVRTNATMNATRIPAMSRTTTSVIAEVGLLGGRPPAFLEEPILERNERVDLPIERVALRRDLLVIGVDHGIQRHVRLSESDDLIGGHVVLVLGPLDLVEKLPTLIGEDGLPEPARVAAESARRARLPPGKPPPAREGILAARPNSSLSA